MQFKLPRSWVARRTSNRHYRPSTLARLLKLLIPYERPYCAGKLCSFSLFLLSAILLSGMNNIFLCPFIGVLGGIIHEWSGYRESIRRRAGADGVAIHLLIVSLVGY
jgi:hypothetical protein